MYDSTWKLCFRFSMTSYAYPNSIFLPDRLLLPLLALLGKEESSDDNNTLDDFIVIYNLFHLVSDFLLEFPTTVF